MLAVARKFAAAATVDGFALGVKDATDIKTAPTLAAGDVQVSKDGGAFANITSLPSETPAGSGMLRVSLSLSEMTAKRVVVRFIDQTASKEWNDDVLVVETFGHLSAQLIPDFADNMRLGLSALPNAQAASPGGLPIYNSVGEVSCTDIVLRLALIGPNIFAPTFTGALPLTNNSTASRLRLSGTIMDSIDHLSGGHVVFYDPHLFYTAAFSQPTFNAGTNEYELPLDLALPFTPTNADSIFIVPSNPRLVRVGGDGPYSVDHNGGSGSGGAACTFYIPYSSGVGVGNSADVLRYTTDGSPGYGGLTLRSYLASDYDAGTRNVLGTTYTKSDGRWAGPLYFASGTYYVIADAADDGYAASQVKVVVP